MTTQEMAALNEELPQLAAAEKITQHHAQKVAKLAGLPFGLLLKVGAILVIIIRQILALATGQPITQTVTIVGESWDITVAPHKPTP